MGNECCSNCNVGGKQRELQDYIIKDTPNGQAFEEANAKIEDGDTNLQIFQGNQKVVTNLAPDQSQNFRKSSLNVGTQHERRPSQQSNAFYENGNTENEQLINKLKDGKRPSVLDHSSQHQQPASVNSARAQINTPKQNCDEVMVLMHGQSYNTDQEIERLLSKFDNMDLINKDRSLKDMRPSSNEVYKLDKTGDIYVGETLNKKRNGFGRLVCQNGSFYEGYWEGDKFNGQGFYLDSEGNYIKGQFKDNKPHGRCLLKKKDGGVYEGEMKNGEKDGEGEETTVKGMTYKGHFKNGQMHGEGKYSIQNMYTFEGQFVNDYIEGQGKCVWKTKKAYNGQWHQNRMHGKGEFTWPDGKRYTGDFYSDQFDGYGEFLWSNGTCYKGQWKQGKMHGAGKITTPEGKEISGNWINGEYQQQTQGNQNKNQLDTQNETTK
ncbi:hypothetical protein ABPG72_020170 [Tetrahymena utriculariae]